MVMFFNKNLDINRFFIEDSDGRQASADQANGGTEMPKIEGSASIG